jgi:ribonucleoside-diphosphate reductase alpha chain
MVLGSDTVKFSTSHIDLVFRELAISYLGHYELAQVDPEQLMQMTGGRKPESLGATYSNGGMTPLFPETQAPSAPVLEPMPTHAHAAAHGSAKAAPSAYKVAREKGYTGDPCPECGHLTLVRNGACLKCQTCGATTGCS